MSTHPDWLLQIVVTDHNGSHIHYGCDAVSINSTSELFICDDDDKVIADYPRMGWVDVTITRNYDS